MQTIRNKEEIILQVVSVMTTLTMEQTAQLKMALEIALHNCKIIQEENSLTTDANNNEHVLKVFIASKKVSGRSDGTLRNYYGEVKKLFDYLKKDYKKISTDDIRMYMYHRQQESNLSNNSVNNIRLCLKSFFKFLMVEEYIDKDPMLRIEALREEVVVRTTLTAEQTELIRCNCVRERDLAIVDFLLSSGVRVGELIKLNISDIDFNNRSAIVKGKGRKERQIYFSGKALVHLKKYLESRNDNNEALFVAIKKPYKRLSASGIQEILRNIPKNNEQTKNIHLHPHACRYTFATSLINKGAPLEHVTEMLGHVNGDTTRKCYAKINKTTIKNSHDKYVD